MRELDEAEKQKQREEDRKVRRMRPGLSDTRKRMLGDIAAHLGGPSKKRKTEAATAATAAEGPVSKSEDWNAFADSHHQHRPGSDRRTDTPQKASDAKVGSSSKELGAESSGAHRNGRASEKSRVSSRRDRDADDSVREKKALFGEADSGRRHNRRDRSHHREERRQSSPELEERKRKRHHHHRHHRFSPRNKRDAPSDDRGSHHRRRRRSSSTESRRDAPSDSDPLDDIIGPAPASASEPVGVVRRRGRGANVNRTSGIDSRFAADYDPRLDVTPEPDDDNNDNDVVVNHQPTNSTNTNTNTNTKNNNEENWDNAVEAFRDRLKWNQQGAERLRSAGFTEDEIRKWEKGGKKDESDVRWNKQGGLREWDRGKVVGDDGRSWCRPRRSGGG